MGKFKKGDIFHDGLLGYWMFHPKKGKGRLMLIMLRDFIGGSKNPCNGKWRNPDGWDFSNISIICNYYDNAKQAASLLDDSIKMKDVTMLHFLM